MNKFIVDIGIIRKNIEATKIKNVKYCAMVKANAYGHGMCTIAKKIEDLVDMFGVAEFAEAVKLRKFVKKDILVTGAFEKKDIKYASQNNIILTLSNLEQLSWLINQKHDIRIHIKVNSGMNRYGFNNINEIITVINSLSNKYIHLEGVYSHISNTNNKLRTQKQIAFFKKVCKILPDNITKHIATIEACQKYNNIAFDMIRAGIAMYGYCNNTTPALTLKSTIVHKFWVKKGEYIGYGNTYKTHKNIKIGVVPLGYYDGINYKLSNKGKVKVGTKLCQIVGRICMDCFMVDITQADSDNVIVLDKQLNADYWAKICKTINYEILTNFKTQRLKYELK